MDLRAVSEADPAGVAVLLVYARLLPTLGGSLAISAASGPCHDILQRMQLSHLIDQPEGTPATTIALPAESP